MFCFLFCLCVSKIKKSYQRNGDYVSLEQFQKLGYSNQTWDSVDELNRALHNFGITDKKSIQTFITLCTFRSNYGLLINDVKFQFSSRFLKNFIYRGSGYLLINGEKIYKQLASYIGDQNIESKGADYVLKHYPWSSSALAWRIINPQMNVIDSKYRIALAHDTLVNYLEGKGIPTLLSFNLNKYPYNKLVEILNKVESIF